MQDLLTRLLLAGGGGFSPSALFGGGAVQGAWYDPSDTTTLFQDDAGTTPVTAVEQPVGLMLDKSKNGVGTNGAKRVNLLTYTELLTNAAWTPATATVSSSGSAPNGSTAWLIYPNSTGSNRGLYNTNVLGLTSASATVSFLAKASGKNWVGIIDASGTSYVNVSTGAAGTLRPNTTASITALGGGWFRVVYTTASTGTNYWQIAVVDADASLAVTANGTDGVIFASPDARLTSEAATLPTYQPITDTWYSTMAGNHAFQSVNTSRPTLRARYNLLTYSEQFENAAWVKTNATVTPNAGMAPDGTTTADLLYPASTGFYRGMYQQPTLAAALYIDGFYVKASGKTWVQILGLNGAGLTGVWFNLANGTVGTQKAGYTGTIQSVGSGWYRVAVTHPSQSNPYVTINVVDGDGIESVTANGTDGVLIWGAQLTATAVFPSNTYQRIADAATYATGTAFPPYLFFDGLDDSMLTNSIDFATVTSDGQARRNLLNNPTQFDVTTSWTGIAATVTANAAVAPDGTTTADKLIDTAASTYHFIVQASVTPTASTNYCGSVYIKSAERTFACLQIVMGGVNAIVGINLSTGALTTPNVGTATVATAGSGWWRLSLSITTSTTATGGLYLYTADSLTNNPTYLGDGTSGVFLWGAQLETGSTATAFQNIGTDQMTVFAGVTKNSDATTAILAELSANGSSNNGAFLLTAPDTASVRYGVGMRGTSFVSITTSAAAYNAPVTNVITGIGNIATPETTWRANGAQVMTSSTTLGTGNFGNYPLFIGRRNNASLPFNGNLYSLIVQGATPTSSQLVSTEQWVAAKTPLGSV